MPIITIQLTWLFEVLESVQARFERDFIKEYPTFQKVSETMD
jgi:hypothetical protein